MYSGKVSSREDRDRVSRGGIEGRVSVRENRRQGFQQEDRGQSYQQRG
jgi:hypothetical protein